MDTDRLTEPCRRQANRILDDAVGKNSAFVQGALGEDVGAHENLRERLAATDGSEVAKFPTVDGFVSVFLVLHDAGTTVLNYGNEEDGSRRLVEGLLWIWNMVLCRLSEDCDRSALDLGDSLLERVLGAQPIDGCIELLKKSDVARTSEQDWLPCNAEDLVDFKDGCIRPRAVRREDNPVGAAYREDERQLGLLKTLFVAKVGKSR